MKKKLFAAIAAGAMTLAMATATFASCSGKEKLIVYTEAGFAPWEFTQSGSLEIVGVDMEIAKYIANKYDYELEVINGNFDTIVAGIDEDNALGIAGISYDATRATKVEFSDFYWEEAYQSVVYLSSYSAEMAGEAFAVSNFAGAKLVYQTGTTSALTVEANETSWGISSKADFTQVMAALEDMKTAQVKEFLIVDSQVAAQLVANNAGISWAAIEGIDKEAYGVVAKKGNKALIEKVNAALAELLVEGSDGKNQIRKWYDQYSAIAPQD